MRITTMTSDKEIDKTPHIRLICYPHDLDTGVKTTVDIMDIDIGRDELVDIFESFMKSLGYYFDEDV